MQYIFANSPTYCMHAMYLALQLGDLYIMYVVNQICKLLRNFGGSKPRKLNACTTSNFMSSTTISLSLCVLTLKLIGWSEKILSQEKWEEVTGNGRHLEP